MGIVPPKKLFQVVDVVNRHVPPPAIEVEKIIYQEKIIEKLAESPELLHKYQLALDQISALSKKTMIYKDPVLEQRYKIKYVEKPVHIEKRIVEYVDKYIDKIVTQVDYRSLIICAVVCLILGLIMGHYFIK